MASEKATALVLRVVEFSETSSIVTLYTREFGKLGGLAKGARRPKGPFDTALDLLSICRIEFIRKNRDVLDLLTEARLERRFRPPTRDLSPLYTGYYIAELLTDLTDLYDPHPELFDAATAALSDLAAGEIASRILLRFEMTLLQSLGHLPSLRDCVECGRPIPPTRTVAFGLIDGGVLCPDCRAGRRHVVTISRAALQTLETFADVQSDAWRAVDWQTARRGELRGVVNQYVHHLLGRRPRMAGYLGFLTR